MWEAQTDQEVYTKQCVAAMCTGSMLQNSPAGKVGIVSPPVQILVEIRDRHSFWDKLQT